MDGQASAVIFDLEYTAWLGSRERRWSDPGEHREVIQIGALKIRAGDGDLLDRFERLVIPRINGALSDYIMALTGIAQHRLDREGVDFEAAYADFLAFKGDAPLFCFGFDEVVIEETIGLYGLDARFKAEPTTNLHAFFRAHDVPLDRVTSGSLIDHFGLPPILAGQTHDAVYDCASILAAARHLMDEGAASPFLSPNPTFGPD
ncbi:MAG: exonuclease domain-containing protein [Alphaproteobacteria bacterium]